MEGFHASARLPDGDSISGMQENKVIAALLREVAELLDDQRETAVCVRTYRVAAETIEQLPYSIRAVMDHEGIDGLCTLPTIGIAIAKSIESYLQHGRWTIVTTRAGSLQGFHIVRGRENESEPYNGSHKWIHPRAASQPPHPELPSRWEDDDGRNIGSE